MPRIGRRIGAIRLVELVIVVSGLAKVVDDVAQVIEERWHIGGVVLSKVGDHLVCDQRLGRGTFDAARISNRMEDDLPGCLNRARLRCARSSINLGESENGLDRAACGLWNRLEIRKLLRSGRLRDS